MIERRHDFDWIRVLAMLNVFIFHCIRFFDNGGWHLKNIETSAIGDIIIGLMWMWIMPILFLVSGVGSWFSVNKYGKGKYILSRFLRLIIPYYTIGMFIMIPPQFYFELVTNYGYTGSFLESIPIMFQNLSFSMDYGPYIIDIFTGHLWFLLFLFFINISIFPLLYFLKSVKGKNVITSVADICSKTGGIFIFLIPLIILKIALKGIFTGNHSWAEFLYYTVFFLIGFMIPADKRFTESIKKHLIPLLVAGFTGFGFAGLFIMVLGYGYPDNESISTWIYFPVQIIISVSQLGFVLFLTGLGMKYMNFSNRFLKYSNEAVLPFYIFHQTVILIIGWFIRTWEINMMIKFLILTASSFAAILLLYEVFVRHLNPVRLLFGMKKKVKKIDMKKN